MNRFVSTCNCNFLRNRIEGETVKGRSLSEKVTAKLDKRFRTKKCVITIPRERMNISSIKKERSVMVETCFSEFEEEQTVDRTRPPYLNKVDQSSKHCRRFGFSILKSNWNHERKGFEQVNQIDNIGKMSMVENSKLNGNSCYLGFHVRFFIEFKLIILKIAVHSLTTP